MHGNCFFNAALTKGKIDIVDPAKSRYENFFGVAFVESDIADVYLKQNQFKGIGIWVDESLHDEISKISGYRLIRSGYLKEVDTSIFEPYYDIAFEYENKVFDQYEDAVVKTIFNECLLAYTKSKRYGRYYLSIIATLINSYSNYYLSWNSAKCNFEKCPMIYYIIMKLAEDNGRSYPYIQGLEMLCLLIVDNVFDHEEVTDIDQSQIVEKFMSYECLKKPYSYSINSLPDVFCSKENRDKFIRIYQENIVNTQVNNLFKDSKEVCD